ncbi:DNA alkylation repair protein [Candidatus Falkowbacteria bacterium]|jgi:3-methyladenine DNA glycosylase AlkD|nr:DNA alkylation repair protein [Candidatus Falkowbacteria bacterium]MBT5503525.1 DNA alkylation repair protein [Candidatus Falkowbacteria bacterium]MBT6574408.1 DNA alkylation repair protein [Candidatus Falkowbacteria bacterium]MBT7348925.1 DNA alkylation repair protein [Candidatus Falkowbacteria bacterium]MBT7501281.1 DNA alkylation repair protein [Candidatus Falkowbacteria bacterium]
MTISQLKKQIRQFGTIERAKASLWFFKTGKGDYGEGDKFLGLKMGEQRVLAKKFVDLELNELAPLLKSEWHEERMIALIILTYKYPKADDKEKKKIYEFYIKHRKAVNNWDLVDVTVPRVIGAYLVDKDRSILFKYANSKDLWEKRIAVLATFAFISRNDFKDSLKIAKILLNDKHDLIHKAVGWMLREIGKRDQAVEEKFLKQHYKKMPRTMLRYSIEKFDEPLRLKYLKGEI